MKIRKAVITAAGWGTRFLPVTKSQPKEMLPLVNKPLIQYSVEEAIACGIEMVVIVTAAGKKSIEDYFDHCFELEHLLERRGEVRLAEELRRLCNMVDICYVRQKEQLGLGHAVLTAKSIIGDEPFVLVLPDDLFQRGDAVLKKMTSVHDTYGANVIAIKQVKDQEVSRYGIIKPKRIADRIYEILNLVEKPSLVEAPSHLAIMGRYVLNPQIFGVLENTPPGKNGEIQLTDGLRQLLKKQSIYGYEFEGELYDVGTPLGWLKTTMALAFNHPEMGAELRDYASALLESLKESEQAK